MERHLVVDEEQPFFVAGVLGAHDLQLNGVGCNVQAAMQQVT